MYWLMIIISITSLTANVINFVNKSSQSVPQMFLMIFQVGLNVSLWTVLRYCNKRKYTSKLIVILYTVEVTVYVNLAMRNMLPSGFPVDMKNLEFFFGQDLVLFIFMNCILFHDVKWVIFCNGPIFIIGSYFIVIQEEA